MTTAQQIQALETRVSELEGHLSMVLELLAAEKVQTVTEPSRLMTEEDAYRVMYGDLKDLKHRDAADLLGLSYGQVYSCRKGHTKRKVSK